MVGDEKVNPAARKWTHPARSLKIVVATLASPSLLLTEIVAEMGALVNP